MAISMLAFALAAANPAAELPVTETTAKLEHAAASLTQGKRLEAIDALERQLKADPNDPALLINIGIAFAQLGEESKARSMFKAAMSSPEHFELETADGTEMDSRRLARKAIAMLDRGEFRPASNRLVLAE